MTGRIIPFILWGVLWTASFLLAEETEEELHEYSAAITQLADNCRGKGMQLEAKVTESRLWKDPPNGFFIPKFSSRPIESLPEDATPEQRKWFNELKTVEKKYGKIFFEHAKKAAEAGDGYTAYRLAEIGFFISPDDEILRKVFGYRLYEGEWHREWEIEQLQKGYIYDSVSGWNSPKETPKKNRKITVETEHFEIKSTASQVDAVNLGNYLEEFYMVWNFLFFPMTMTEKEAVSTVLNGEKKGKNSKYKVLYFKSREEYLKEVMRIDSGGEISNGGYFPDKKTVYLYTPDSEEENESSLYTVAVHEVTHQLFTEASRIRSSERRKINPGADSQFWMTEGIAVYLETFEKVSLGYYVGGLKSYRFIRAKERADEPEGLFPVKSFMEMGKEEFQNHQNPPQLYTESAGLTSFFLHGKDGKYRGPFLSALFDVYCGKESSDMLEEMLGISSEQLDLEFREYLNETPFTE